LPTSSKDPKEDKGQRGPILGPSECKLPSGGDEQPPESAKGSGDAQLPASSKGPGDEQRAASSKGSDDKQRPASPKGPDDEERPLDITARARRMVAELDIAAGLKVNGMFILFFFGLCKS
jgi:hypothetical protein